MQEEIVEGLDEHADEPFEGFDAPDYYFDTGSEVSTQEEELWIGQAKELRREQVVVPHAPALEAEHRPPEPSEEPNILETILSLIFGEGHFIPDNSMVTMKDR